MNVCVYICEYVYIHEKVCIDMCVNTHTCTHTQFPFPDNKHLYCFQFGKITNKATVNILVYVFLLLEKEYPDPDPKFRFLDLAQKGICGESQSTVRAAGLLETTPLQSKASLEGRKKNAPSFVSVSTFKTLLGVN